MPIYNSPNATITLPLRPPTGLILPLEVAFNAPDWPILFHEFFLVVNKSKTSPNFGDQKSGLSRLIFDNWLADLFKKDPLSGNWTYKSATVTDRPTLFAALNAQLTAKPQSELFLLIGMYLFVVWFLSTKGSSGRVPSVVTDYIKQEIVKHKYVDPNPNNSIEWNSGPTFPSTFTDAFSHDNSLLKFALEMQNIRSHLVFTTGAAALPAFALATPSQRTAIKAAVCSYIQKARALLEDVVHFEVLKLLGAIRPSLADHYGRMSILAAGLGQDTHGFFGSRVFGILFFNYELECQTSVTDFGLSGIGAIDYLGVKKERNWEGKDISSVFVSHVGIDKSFQLLYDANVGQPTRRQQLIPHIELERSEAAGISETAVLYAVDNEGYSFATDPPSSLYDGTTGTIPLTEFQSVSLTMRTNMQKVDGVNLATDPLLPAVNELEELAFFIFPNTIDRTTASASASAFWLLPDNEFWKDTNTIHQEVFRPGGTVDPELDAVIAELVFGPDFTVSADLRGQGVGKALDATELTADGPTITRDSNQHDRPIQNAGSNNDLLRYAHGSMTYSGNAAGGKLEFKVVAFASPLHCTWETKLLDHPLMFSEVGQWLEHDQGRIWYNGALSAFRAFGFFKAMIEAVKNRIDELSTSDANLSIAAPQIRARLDDYLNNIAKVQIKTQSGNPVKTGPPGTLVEVVVDHNRFIKFAP
jgi:hypothetical protein